MQKRMPKSLSWSEVLAALRACSSEFVLIRDGKLTEPAGSVGSRPSAKGTELCLFPSTDSTKRLDLVQHLTSLASSPGRRFMTSARAKINDSHLLVESVGDEDTEDGRFAVIKTRRPTLAYNQSQQSGDTTTFRNKRIKNG
jgi:hypothetical protein